MRVQRMSVKMKKRTLGFQYNTPERFMKGFEEKKKISE